MPHPKTKLGIAVDRSRYERQRPDPEDYLPADCPECDKTLRDMNDVLDHRDNTDCDGIVP